MQSPPRSKTEYQEQCNSKGYTPLSSWTLRSGSEWRYEELLTFRVLYQQRGKLRHPDFLEHNILKAKKILNKSQDFKHALRLLYTRDWQKLPHKVLRRQGKVFGNFFCLLAELMEKEPQTATPRKSERNKNKEPSSLSSGRGAQKAAVTPAQGSQSSSSESPAVSSGMSESSVDYSDAKSLQLQKKSEAVANTIILDMLGSLSACTSNDDEDRGSSQFEWATDQDNFNFKVPKGKYVNTRNDGGLVRRFFDSAGLWTRESAHLCYCSIEAKSTNKASGAQTTSNVYAQQASQIVGMIHQRKSLGGEQVLGQKARAIFPLISISHRRVSVIFATHTPGYDDFLTDGNIAKKPFLTMAEYGGFVLSSRKRFKKLSELIIALMLYLEDSTDEDSRSENDENDSDEEGDNEDEDMEVDDMGEEDESSDSD